MQKSTLQEFLKNYLFETWKEIKTDIDFSKYKPIDVKQSLHIHEERYFIDNETYRLLYPIDSDENYSVEILVKNERNINI